MTKKNSWARVATPELRHDMEQTARAAYANGRDLAQDAGLLLGAERYARASALAVLAEEELSKAFTLLICAADGRWDSTVFNGLRQHAVKQGLAEGMLRYMEWLRGQVEATTRANAHRLTPLRPPMLPPQQKWDEILGAAEAIRSRPVRDFQKQDAFYVSFDEHAKLVSSPSSVAKADAERCMAISKALQEIVELMLA